MKIKGVMLCYAMLSHFSCVRLCATPQTAAHQLLRPWDSPGKNTGVGCHFLLQCMKVKSESEVAQSCPTLSDPMDCSLTGSSTHGIFQARVLEWGAIAFSEILYGSWPKNQKVKHKQYCNKLNEDFENGPHKKRLFKKTVKSSQKKKKKERKG